MNMVRHHDPRPKFITFAMKEPQGVLDQLCLIRTAQEALAIAFIQIRVIIYLTQH